MEYPKRSMNGDAGEYFVAYTVTRLFGWPCRLFNVDIGVDAELEIMDANGISTGNVIKIQVKTFDRISSATSKSIYVDDRHIDYWKRFCLPVIMCCVDLSSQEVYWTQILGTSKYLSSGDSRRIDLDLQRDRMTASCKQRLELLAIPEASKNIEPLFQRLDAAYKPIKETGAIICIDGNQLLEIEERCRIVNEIVLEIENLILHFPWRVGALDLRKLSRIKHGIQTTLNEASYSFSVGVNGM